ncbi:class I SAM-dependent methyltransferase [Leptothoe spongobia]|uniref:Class I SAM-dependent methyltransferase n=1 Tax=Leptothoe spongobia TAU-MAC 1115 TaxID=1967444 RepID=A0A947GHD8_9CYAN|nr:class I SAM-dependent methyltransferase [Leptothoe spongobia]MBT9314934.1 class I SAM-dependent methyltransferase [Leptothoe spongobia TAU-MAC 1115]
MTSENEASVSAAVAKLYDTYPFPPEPLIDEPPPGYNWRWYWPTAYSFCTGRLPATEQVRILDAGCGSGVGTEYLVHLNPEAQVTGIDLSAGTLAVARERCQRSGADRVSFHNLSIYDVDQIEGQFDLINCVGVLHHMPDPIRGIQALAQKVAPGGLLHIFVYAALGRWEISLMQQAISMVQGDRRGDYRDGVAVGRQIFDALPENNRIVKRDKERWALENHQDECFADMYVHPQEVDYTIDTLFELIDASGLEFVGFSNPQYWSLERLIGKAPDVMERAKTLNQRAQYRLIELLDPELTHYEFFLARPPLPQIDWANDQKLLAAKSSLNPCLSGWPSQSFFNPDYQLVTVTDNEYQCLKACDASSGHHTVADLLTDTAIDLTTVRSLQKRQLILLTPDE